MSGLRSPRFTVSRGQKKRSYRTTYQFEDENGGFIKCRPAVTWTDASSELSNATGLSATESSKVLSFFWNDEISREMSDVERYKYSLEKAIEYYKEIVQPLKERNRICKSK